MKIFITGASGQLGFTLLQDLSKNKNYQIIAGVRKTSELIPPEGALVTSFDLSDKKLAVHKIREHSPDLIINAAAYTAVDQAEKEQELCHLINHKNTVLAAQTAKQIGAKFLHFSSDYVYHQDNQTKINEQSLSYPQSTYAKSKLAADQDICNMKAQSLILRTSWVYSEHGKNFVRTILKHAKQKKTLHVVDDQIGAPTSCHSISRAISILLNHAKSSSVFQTSLYNFSDEGEISWFDFAKYIISTAQKKGLELSVKEVIPIKTKDYVCLATRPHNSRLDMSKFCKKFDYKAPDWRIALNEVIEKIILKDKIYL